MARWTVAWSIDDEEAVDPFTAAQNAWDSLRREGSIANVFEVSDEHDMTVSVDLSDGSIGLRAWVPGDRAIAELAEYMNNTGWAFDEIVEMIRRPHKYAQQYTEMLTARAYDVVAKEPEEIDTDLDADAAV
jgi:hypothetical protein